MQWQFCVREGRNNAVYTVEADRYYEGKIKALKEYLRENNIIDTPAKYLSENGKIVKVEGKCLEPRRKVSGDKDRYFYLDQVDRLRRLVRECDFTSEERVKIVSLLSGIRRVIKNGEQVTNRD